MPAPWLVSGDTIPGTQYWDLLRTLYHSSDQPGAITLLCPVNTSPDKTLVTSPASTTHHCKKTAPTSIFQCRIQGLPSPVLLWVSKPISLSMQCGLSLQRSCPIHCCLTPIVWFSLLRTCFYLLFADPGLSILPRSHPQPRDASYISLLWTCQPQQVQHRVYIFISSLLVTPWVAPPSDFPASLASLASVMQA